jgi:hypothetical protein
MSPNRLREMGKLLEYLNPLLGKRRKNPASEGGNNHDSAKESFGELTRVMRRFATRNGAMHKNGCVGDFGTNWRRMVGR